MKVVLQLVFFLVLLISFADLVYACHCSSSSQQQRFRAANTVFIGEVIEFKVRPDLETETNQNLKYIPYQVTFNVEKQWKGKRQSKITALADYDSPGFCGDLDLQAGKRFLIYAPRNYGHIIVYRDCGPNRDIENARSEIKNLSNFFFQTYTFLYPFPKF
jgi:hypothetical protein